VVLRLRLCVSRADAACAQRPGRGSQSGAKHGGEQAGAEPTGATPESQGSTHVQRPPASVMPLAWAVGRPPGARLAVGEPIVKSAAGGPPGPTER
jgi:hypothetical protein